MTNESHQQFHPNMNIEDDRYGRDHQFKQQGFYENQSVNHQSNNLNFKKRPSNHNYDNYASSNINEFSYKNNENPGLRSTVRVYRKEEYNRMDESDRFYDFDNNEADGYYSSGKEPLRGQQQIIIERNDPINESYGCGLCYGDKRTKVCTLI